MSNEEKHGLLAAILSYYSEQSPGGRVGVFLQLFMVFGFIITAGWIGHEVIIHQPTIHEVNAAANEKVARAQAEVADAKAELTKERTELTEKIQNLNSATLIAQTYKPTYMPNIAELPSLEETPELSIAWNDLLEKQAKGSMKLLDKTSLQRGNFWDDYDGNKVQLEGFVVDIIEPYEDDSLLLVTVAYEKPIVVQASHDHSAINEHFEAFFDKETWRTYLKDVNRDNFLRLEGIISNTGALVKCKPIKHDPDRKRELDFSIFSEEKGRRPPQAPPIDHRFDNLKLESEEP